MQNEQQQVIKQYWNQLVQLNEIRKFANTLIQKEIFSSTEISNIFFDLDENTNQERFFHEFLEKDEQAFNSLIEWLIQTDHGKLARKLAAKRTGITPFNEPNDEENSDVEEFSQSIEIELPVGVFDDSKAPLEIKVRAGAEFLDSAEQNPHVPFYNCRSRKRGRVLIINNYDFTGTDHNTRTGAEVDEKNLRTLFEQMGGWVVKSKTNKTAEEMRAILKSFAKEKREKRCDICFVIIMSHGSEKLNDTIIFGSDGRYLYPNDIQSFFTNEKCPLFRGKPKVFIYQVCRGPDIDLPRTYPTTTNTEFDGKCNNQEEIRQQQQRRVNNQSNNQNFGYFRPVEDMLIGYATMQGSKAHRDPFRGTWYIELICKHFMELARCESVDNLLVKVDAGLRKRMSEYGTVQTAEHISRGFKKLYLNPGIYEENGKLVKFINNNDNEQKNDVVDNKLRGG